MNTTCLFYILRRHFCAAALLEFRKEVQYFASRRLLSTLEYIDGPFLIFFSRLENLHHIDSFLSKTGQMFSELL